MKRAVRRLIFMMLGLLVLAVALMHVNRQEILYSSSAIGKAVQQKNEAAPAPGEQLIVCQYFSFNDFKKRTYTLNAKPENQIEECRDVRRYGVANVQSLY